MAADLRRSLFGSSCLTSWRNVLCWPEHYLDLYDKYHENPQVKSDYKDELAPWFVLLFPSNIRCSRNSPRHSLVLHRFPWPPSNSSCIYCIPACIQSITEDGCVYSGCRTCHHVLRGHSRFFSLLFPGQIHDPPESQVYCLQNGGRSLSIPEALWLWLQQAGSEHPLWIIQISGDGSICLSKTGQIQSCKVGPTTSLIEGGLG